MSELVNGEFEINLENEGIARAVAQATYVWGGAVGSCGDIQFWNGTQTVPENLGIQEILNFCEAPIEEKTECPLLHIVFALVLNERHLVGGDQRLQDHLSDSSDLRNEIADSIANYCYCISMSTQGCEYELTPHEDLAVYRGIKSFREKGSFAM